MLVIYEMITFANFFFIIIIISQPSFPSNWLCSLLRFGKTLASQITIVEKVATL